MGSSRGFHDASIAVKSAMCHLKASVQTDRLSSDQCWEICRAFRTWLSQQTHALLCTTINFVVNAHEKEVLFVYYLLYPTDQWAGSFWFYIPFITYKEQLLMTDISFPSTSFRRFRCHNHTLLPREKPHNDKLVHPEVQTTPRKH